MAKYRVPQALSPGVYRGKDGLYYPGAVFEMPDTENPNRLLIAMDSAAKAALKRVHGIDAHIGAADPDAPKPAKSSPKTEEALEEPAPQAESGKGKRLADK